MNIKLIYSAEGQRKSRWLDELPDWETLGNDCKLELSKGKRSVTITTDNPRVPPLHHLVSFTEAVRGAGCEYWQDCGKDLQEAIKFALDVWERGADAFEFESAELTRLRELEASLKKSPGRPQIETDNPKTLAQRRWREKSK